MRWKISNKLIARSSKPAVDELIKILLKNRGLKTGKQQQEFLNPKDPRKFCAEEVGISSVQLKKALNRLKKAIKNKEKIIIYGDYDADGLCATAIIWEVLHRLKAQVMPFVPTRQEGYGMKVERIEKFAREKVNLIITVDQGIVASKAVEKAKKLGIDVIVTDHHLPGKKKPPALAVIHTSKLSGAGVAWFLANHLGEQENLDLATIGTVGDIVPLLGVNRSLVKFGLEAVRKTKRLGFLSLFKIAGLDKEKIGTDEISFMIVPRLNATGRMDNPLDSLRLLCTSDVAAVNSLVKVLDQRNRQRQEIMSRAITHAKQLWLKEDGKSILIFISHESYQEGIVGLMAGRLMEEFYRPVVIVAKGEKVSRASARSIEGFNIVEAVRACADLLNDHGGHPKAAGFTIETEKIELLKSRLMQITEEKLKIEKLIPTLKIDLEISLADLNFDLYCQLAKMAPFGEGNPQPVFASRGLKVMEARLVGNGNRHLKLQVMDSKSGASFPAIGFGWGDFYFQLSPEKPIEIAYTLELDEWNRQRRLQLKLKDIKLK